MRRIIIRSSFVWNALRASALETEKNIYLFAICLQKPISLDFVFAIDVATRYQNVNLLMLLLFIFSFVVRPPFTLYLVSLNPPCIASHKCLFSLNGNLINSTDIFKTRFLYPKINELGFFPLVFFGPDRLLFILNVSYHNVSLCGISDSKKME